MSEKYTFTAEEMLEQIFYYINELTSETNFSTSILLLTDLGRTLVNADRTSFWYRDKKNKSYWTLAASSTGRIVVSEGQGIIGASIENDETILINDAYSDPRFNPEVDKKTGYVTKAILCMPVKNSAGEVIAAYQAINKLFCENEWKSFTYVNREEDMGIEGLRKAKESYYPHHMVEKCWACLLEEGYEY